MPRILFPHLPKCAGMSIKNQIADNPRVVLDYFNHPTWQSAPDIAEGRRQQADLIASLAARDDWILFGHYKVSAHYGHPYDRQILMLRDPVDRAISHYHFIQQSLPINAVTIRRHPEVQAVKQGSMPLEDFIQLDHIRYFYSRYYLDGLKRDERSVFLDMRDFASACKTLSRHLDIPIDPGIHLNVTARPPIDPEWRALLDEDTQLVAELLRHRPHADA